MFGYIRPLKGELKVWQYEHFKAEYCGLCHELKSRYGFAASFLVNYDFTCLAMLLETGEPVMEKRRCIASPCRKKCVCCKAPALSTAADMCIILTYHKVSDDVADLRFIKKTGAKLVRLLLKRAYRKAESRNQQFADTVENCLHELSELEISKTDNLDMVADSFARIMQATALAAQPDIQRIMEQIMYHMGRWIYIIDAYDDLREDFEANRYNPLVERFSLTSPQMPEEEFEYLKTTLEHSLNMCRSSFELLPKNYWTSILENIFYFGMPHVANEIYSGIKRKDKDI